MKHLYRTAALVFISCGIAHAADTAGASRAASDFYTWYIQLAKQNHRKPAADRALRMKPALFDAVLLKALRSDLKAQREAAQIVGIDWDPFLSGQDMCEQYPLGDAVQKGNAYWVPVYCTQIGNRKLDTPVVNAVLAFRHGQWIFQNFVYNDGDDLLSELAMLKMQRERSMAPPPAPPLQPPQRSR